MRKLKRIFQMSSIGVLKVMKVIMKKTMRVGRMDREVGWLKEWKLDRKVGEEKLHQPQQVRHVNIEATVKGSRYLRSVELKHVVVFGCVKTVEA
ncbi:hypothetical protein Patl1_37070 [Pistacia atlantica]|nr:hypothetical protein Patl1_37070 [Pistacia atlantica]